MNRPTLSGILLRSLLLPALCLCAVQANAATQRVELDQATSDAKSALLAKERDVRQQRLALRYPPYARIELYAEARMEGFILESMRIAIDGRQVYAHNYELREARALAHGGVQRARRLAIAPGEHTVSVEYSGRRIDRRGDGTPVSERLQATFYKGPEALNIVVPLREGPGPLEFSTLDIAGQTGNNNNQVRRVQAGSRDDPRVGHARYLSKTGDHFAALVELALMDGGSGDFALAEPYYWLLAESYLNFGMLAPAQRAYDRVSRMTEDRERLTESLLDLAEFEYQRGYLFEAVQRLRRLRNDVERNYLTRWQDLTSRVLLEQGRFSEAADVLREKANRDDHTPFMRYNLGIALINAGDLSAGRSALDEISRQRPDGAVELALRDKANLTLGYHFLRQQLGGTAKPMFARIRTEGPFSNRALLGMGWAELAPEGSRQQRQAVGDASKYDAFRDVASLGVLIRPGFFEAEIYKRLANRPFRRAGISDDENQSLLRALTVWNELVQRDPMDAAVQEAMLAIPYALDRLGDYQGAVQRYQDAIDVFEQARERIDAGIESVQGALMLNAIVRRDADAQSGYNWRLLDLPDLPETYWLNRLLAEHRFQEQLKNYRDARLLTRRIEDLRNDVDRTFQAASALPPPPESVLFADQYDIYARSDLPALRLRMADRLTLRSDNAVPPVAEPSLALRESDLPQRFEGQREAYAEAVTGLSDQQQTLEALARRQSEAVRTLAIDDLEAQREILKKYLLEARFAVARLYDRELRDQPANTP
ncbi:MAG: tetratricopeptide repeat protein [Algiphilus sp.]